MPGFFPDIFPPEAEFLAAAQERSSHILYTRLIADLETPVSAMLKLMRTDAPCFLLESVLGGETRGRYSIIGLQPDLIWRCVKEKAEISRDGGRSFAACAEDSITSFRALLADIRMEVPEGLPPMAAGLIGYFGYDMIKQVETLPSRNPDPIGIPDACLMRPGVLVIFDTVDGVITVTAPIWADKAAAERGGEAPYAEAAARLAKTVETLAAPLSPALRFHSTPDAAPVFTPNMKKDAYYRMVEEAKEHIRAGDIFQVVLSQRFSAPFALPPFAFYRALRYLNPSPFLVYLHLGGFSLIGSSPEILVRVRENTVTIRPIAGTRRRGKTRAEDAALEAELLADPKEIAEHLMLLDLGRNDVGRCAATGTVRVTERMRVERYSHVMHVVSNVEGTLDPRYTCFDALMSGFPAGTVSGAPKIRAMEIIDALEPHARSFYGGCMGYFSADGSMDTCITLRTGLVKDEVLHVQAGGGIVADSSPEGEYRESLNKARALMRAAEFAENFTPARTATPEHPPVVS